MLRRIQIENFRGIPQMDIPVEQVTALLSPNSSGKTTVLHAIRMA